MTFAKRRATVVLVTERGEILGRLPELSLDAPWWQEVSDLVPAVRHRYGIDVSVLRVLGTERAQPHGGGVEYLAEVASSPEFGRVELCAWDGDTTLLDDHPLRAPWARLGGPAQALGWADGELRRLGLQRVGAPEQIRTWNLSGLWRIPLHDGAAWLKLVPSFFAHEGAVIQELGSDVVPRVLAALPGRTLMAEIPGEDRWAAEFTELCGMVTLLVELQSRTIERADAFRDLGVADWCAGALTEAIGSVVRRTEHELEPHVCKVLSRFVDGLPARFASIAALGDITTLVHGDFHPGNVRGLPGGPHVLMDWGDAGVGHPLLDEPSFIERVPPALVDRVRAHWHSEAQRLLGVEDPARVSRQVAPVAAARKAVIYRRFLDAIEPSEHRYHRNDPAHWLTRTAQVVAAETD